MKRILFVTLSVLAIAAMTFSVAAAGTNRMIGINILVKGNITKPILADLATHGKVRDVVYEIAAVTMQIPEKQLAVIRALPYVAAANPDDVRKGAPVDGVDATDFMNGMSTWDQDAINVTNFSAGRTIDYDGTGVYVAVIDTGLLDSWRMYFPQERIATQYGIAFGGGGGEVGSVSSQPNKWQHDQNSHGTHVTSTILGYNRLGVPVNGVAPLATVIPVKVLNQNGSGWSSVVARGITYVADLKAGPLAGHPVVINMSLGGPSLDPMEKAAIDYAIGKGVIVVASAGNEGLAGMGYPGAYAPVIAVAASGWVGEWPTDNRGWWYNTDVPDPIDAADFYITDFSSRQLAGQDLDVAAPGSWVVGPYQVNSGQLSFYYLGGTSMASPHVAGIAALMMQKDPALTQSDVETKLEQSAIPMPPGCRTVNDPSLGPTEFCWDTDATGAGLATADGALGLVP